MEEVKLRLSSIESITTRSLTTGHESLDGEFVFLQFRKVVELIAFGSLVANKDIYSTAHANFADHWKAKDMLAAIERLNPKFFPVALQEPKSRPDGTRHFDLVTDGFLTKDDCLFLYDKSSDIIHSWNPFTSRPKVVDVMYSGTEWVERTRRLLAWHLINLVDGRVWLVNASSHPVHVYPAQ